MPNMPPGAQLSLEPINPTYMSAGNSRGVQTVHHLRLTNWPVGGAFVVVEFMLYLQMLEFYFA